jgi:outer membrane receptor protein involved in Fe transport
VERYRQDMSNQTFSRGIFAFANLESFLRNQPLRFVGLRPDADVERNWRSTLFAAYLQDDLRVTPRLTLNLGARYEVVRPYTETEGRMVNLDVAPDFSGVVPVQPGGTGLYSGVFPDGLVRGDYNNLAPRVGLAWRATPRTVVRGGFGVSFNNGTYAAIARQLVAQPPFAVTSTSIGSPVNPLDMSDPFAGVEASTTTNNYGVDRDYQLGVINTWNVDVDRNLARGWQAGAGYTSTRGVRLDVLRAPNRGPDGLRIDGVQPFLWQTAEGRSTLHSATFRLRRQQVRGIAGSLSYTLARSMDDASSIGGGGRVVAQDDRNLDAEWGLSSFDRRHQLAGSLSVELPFGADRPWLNQGGPWAAMLSNWSISTSVSLQSGTPFTARLIGAASDVARGTNGTLRADETGAPVDVDEPTLLRYFNTAAFAVPVSGAFGTAGRNTIIGPGQRQVDASLGRDIRLGGNQAISIRVQASNLFNSVRFAAVDTAVNSPTFGQVVSIRPMRTVGLNVRFRF